MTDFSQQFFGGADTAANIAALTPAFATPATGPAYLLGIYYLSDQGALKFWYNGAFHDLSTLLANFTLTGVISPTALSASVNDYNPTGLATCAIMRQDSDAAHSITGITAPSIGGQTIFFYNISASTITLTDQDAASSAANRFDLGGSDIAVAASQVVILQYDATTQRWRAVAGGGGGGSGTVTSVALSLPSVLTVSGSPVTTSGTLTAVFAYPLVQPQGRLTLQSATPVMTADQTAKSTVYYDSYVGKLVPIYNGTNWIHLPIGSDEISMGLDAVTPHIASGSLYDIWAFSNGGTLTICAGPAWSSSTSRGTGAGTTELALQDGIYVNANNLTTAWGGASGTTDYATINAGLATYLGTLYATANGQTGCAFQPSAAAGGTNNILGLYNAYNRVPVRAMCRDNTASWTYATTTWRSLDNSASNRISFVDGLQRSMIYGVISQAVTSNTAGAATGVFALNLDSTSADPDLIAQVSVSSNATLATATVADAWFPQLGFHYIQGMEAAAGGTFLATGSTTTPNRQRSGIVVTIEM